MSGSRRTGSHVSTTLPIVWNINTVACVPDTGIGQERCYCHGERSHTWWHGLSFLGLVRLVTSGGAVCPGDITWDILYGKPLQFQTSPYSCTTVGLYEALIYCCAYTVMFPCPPVFYWPICLIHILLLFFTKKKKLPLVGVFSWP